MKASEGQIGRVFVLRLEDGDEIPAIIERFAAERGVSTGHVILVGGLDSGDIIVGPRDGATRPPQPMFLPIDGAHEVAGVGTLAPDEEGNPVLHMHAALGRSGRTLSGCLRLGVRTWLAVEVIIYEITGIKAVRALDKETGFKLLEIRE
jgi:predicted DNA-binding protein with PD1-like motif